MTSHRGAHPEDETLFSAEALPTLRDAVYDLSWLRSRGYGNGASVKLVGDRYRLHRRQRNAVARSAEGAAVVAHRQVRRRPLSSLAGRQIDVDGFNVLITIEGGLGGAYSFVGQDGAYRDVAPVRGTYDLVEETRTAIASVRNVAVRHALNGVVWWLDDHVSNVGRLAEALRSVDEKGLRWTVRTHDAVDRVLIDRPFPVASSDSEVLDRVEDWCVLERAAFRHVPAPNVCDLRRRGRQCLLPGSKGPVAAS